MKIRLARICTCALSGMAGLAVAGSAGASGFQLLEQNASGLATAYAGSAAIGDNASTVFFNPAGMTRLQAREVSAGLAAVKPSFKFSDRGSVIAPATGTGSGDAGDWAYIPNGFVSWGLNRNLYFGVGLSAPFGLKTEYDQNWVGRFQAISFDIKTYNVNPSVAYRVSDSVSVGLGASWQRMEARYERQAAVAHPTIPALNPVVQATRVTLDADDDSWGWNAGVLIDASPSTRIGASYRSAMKYSLAGTLTSTNQAVSPDVAAKADLKLPDTAILSVAHRLGERWTLLGDLSWTGWSSLQKVNIVRVSGGTPGSVAQTLDADFRDTWRMALGGIYRYNGAWDLKFGIAWDQSPVRSPGQRLVSLPDNDRLWFSGGAQWRMSGNTRLDLGLAYLHVRSTEIDNNQTLLGRGRVTGSYDSSVWILGAQFSHSF